MLLTACANALLKMEEWRELRLLGLVRIPEASMIRGTCMPVCSLELRTSLSAPCPVPLVPAQSLVQSSYLLRK